MVTRSLRSSLAVLCCVLPLLTSAPSSADPPSQPARGGERPSAHYASLLVAEITPALTALAESSPRVRVDQLGRSAGGLPLLLATVSSPDNLARLESARALRQAMVSG